MIHTQFFWKRVVPVRTIYFSVLWVQLTKLHSLQLQICSSKIYRKSEETSQKHLQTDSKGGQKHKMWF